MGPRNKRSRARGQHTKRVLGTVARTLGEIGNEADVEDTKGDHVPYPSQKEKKKLFERAGEPTCVDQPKLWEDQRTWRAAPNGSRP